MHIQFGMKGLVALQTFFAQSQVFGTLARRSRPELVCLHQDADSSAGWHMAVFPVQSDPPSRVDFLLCGLTGWMCSLAIFACFLFKWGVGNRAFPHVVVVFFFFFFFFF